MNNKRQNQQFQFWFLLSGGSEHNTNFMRAFRWWQLCTNGNPRRKRGLTLTCQTCFFTANLCLHWHSKTHNRTTQAIVAVLLEQVFIGVRTSQTDHQRLRLASAASSRKIYARARLLDHQGSFCRAPWSPPDLSSLKIRRTHRLNFRGQVEVKRRKFYCSCLL